MAKPNPKGWDQLVDLAEQNSATHVWLALAKSTSLLELTPSSAFEIVVEKAPDGEHALDGAGQIVVKDGKFLHVLGTPNANAIVNPEG